MAKFDVSFKESIREQAFNEELDHLNNDLKEIKEKQKHAYNRALHNDEELKKLGYKDKSKTEDLTDTKVNCDEYLILNADKKLNERAKEITREMAIADRLKYGGGSTRKLDLKKNIMVIDKKVEIYAHFIEDRLGTRKKIDEKERMTDIFLNHLKLDGQAKELVVERMRVAKLRQKKRRQIYEDMWEKDAERKRNSIEQIGVDSVEFNF